LCFGLLCHFKILKFSLVVRLELKFTFKMLKTKMQNLTLCHLMLPYTFFKLNSTERFTELIGLKLNFLMVVWV